MQVDRHLESEDIAAAVEDTQTGSEDVVPGEDFLDMGVAEETESDCQSEFRRNVGSRLCLCLLDLDTECLDTGCRSACVKAGSCLRLSTSTTPKPYQWSFLLVLCRGVLAVSF